MKKCLKINLSCLEISIKKFYVFVKNLKKENIVFKTASKKGKKVFSA